MTMVPEDERRDEPARTPPTVVWHAGESSRADRQRLLGQRGGTVWLTGLSGSGKSTIAARIEARLLAAGRACYRLDGDNLRLGINADLAFGAADRRENVRRTGEIAALLADAGLVAIACLISPYREDRARVRTAHERTGVAFLEVHVDAPLAVAESRDPKGLYARARRGEIRGFTGIDDPFEPPERPDLRLETARRSIDACADALLDTIVQHGLVPPMGPLPPE